MSKNTTMTLLTLASAYRLVHEGDRAAERATDGALVLLDEGTPYEFRGTELRVLAPHPQGGAWQSTDGVNCTCGAQGLTCRHRVLYALLLAQAALQSPLGLRGLLIEQIAPLERSATYGDVPFEPDPTAAWPADLEDLYPPVGGC